MTQPTISEFYEHDHDRLDELFKTFQKFKRTDFAKAKAAFVEFKTGLQRHIVWEEDILFPLFEAKTGMKEFGPTAVMRQEHRQIGGTLEAIHQKVREGNPDSDTEEDMLLFTLSTHNMKEEKILYPAIDGSLGSNEIKKVFLDMEKVPPERYKSCCGGH